MTTRRYLVFGLASAIISIGPSAGVLAASSPPSLRAYVGSFENAPVFGLFVAERDGKLYASFQSEDGARCYIAEQVKGGMRFGPGGPSDYGTPTSRARVFSAKAAFDAAPTADGLVLTGLLSSKAVFLRTAKEPKASDLIATLGESSRSCLPSTG